MTPTPGGFSSVTARLGLRDDGDDFALVHTPTPAGSAAVFTQSRFAGPSVQLSRDARDAQAREDAPGFCGIVTIAKNANVATGQQGLANAREVRALAATLVGCDPDQILIASTGVIGVQYPMEIVRRGIKTLPTPSDCDLDAVAAAIMTTDTHPKRVDRMCGNAVITGVAKGVGMIEPDMATLLTYFFTDAQIDTEPLQSMFTRVVARTFNALSIDTDTSTSDTACILASGAAGPVDEAAFEQALYEVALDLVRMIAADGEGASKLIEVRVQGARDDDQARRVAKSVVNSPLVKTAVHGADPNWGRVAMAIGKTPDCDDVEQTRVTITFGDQQVYPVAADEAALERLRGYLSGSQIVIGVDLSIAAGAFTAYGCDLTDGYIRINADYTT